MLEAYSGRFSAVELNFSYYRVPGPRMLAGMAASTPPGFEFWVKANRKTTHEQDRSIMGEFLGALAPLEAERKLAGVLLQFPQSFHRTVANRKYLATVIGDFGRTSLAVEFRHHSWEHDSTFEGLESRQVALVVPDVPELPGLFRLDRPRLTSPIGYLRLHSRKAENWYGDSGGDRYDYCYTQEELQELIGQWSPFASQAERVYVFFNNCHAANAASNAEAFERLLRES
jgi:uncharacterized protein YecE (DUF72 family)